MAEFTWKLRDAAGEDLRETEAFSSQAEAEAWMTAHWGELLDEGGESVSLMSEGKSLYEMGLREA